jgi:hypothetical protein
LLTSGAVAIFEGSSLFARFFFSVNKDSHIKQYKVPAQYEDPYKDFKKAGKYVTNVHITTICPTTKQWYMHPSTYQSQQFIILSRVSD